MCTVLILENFFFTQTVPHSPKLVAGEYLCDSFLLSSCLFSSEQNGPRPIDFRRASHLHHHDQVTVTLCQTISVLVGSSQSQKSISPPDHPTTHLHNTTCHSSSQITFRGANTSNVSTLPAMPPQNRQKPRDRRQQKATRRSKRLAGRSLATGDGDKADVADAAIQEGGEKIVCPFNNT